MVETKAQFVSSYQLMAMSKTVYRSTDEEKPGTTEDSIYNHMQNALGMEQMT